MRIEIDGDTLALEDIERVATDLSTEVVLAPGVEERIVRSRAVVEDAIARGAVVYGVTTGFGRLAETVIPLDRIEELQLNLIRSHACGTGAPLTRAETRAITLLRANVLARGFSGVRPVVVRRLLDLLNRGVHPIIPEQGSVGASGDLAPLSHLALVLLGEGQAEFGGEVLDGGEALRRAGLEPLRLQAKEGLALNNGTGASTGIAANALDRALGLAALTLGIHALYAQALLATDQSFAPFIHAMKPHPGQIWVAEWMAELLKGSGAIRSEAAGQRGHRAGKLIQDRYSLRCLPQYMGPIVDGIVLAGRQIETVVGLGYRFVE